MSAPIGRVPADVIGVQMRAHHVIDITHRETGVRQSLFEAVAVQHVPEWACRPRFVIADASVDQDVLTRHLYDKALNAKHQAVLRVNKLRLEPGPVFLEQFLAKLREETQRIKERALLLDDGMNCDVTKRERLRHLASAITNRGRHAHSGT